MRKERLILLNKKKTTDKIGNTNETYEVKKTIWCDFILPYRTEQAKQDYGLDVKVSHRTFTFEDVFVKDYAEIKGVIYLISEVIQYPNQIKVVLLERI